MKITGIITEYNPFHNGHKLHLDKTKELTKADAIVAIMSGNFVQRGIPAIVDKWTRAEMAVKNGVDCVIELPTVFSVSSAEFFAKGAIDILNSMKVINTVCFGSEIGNMDLIKETARILYDEPENFKTLLKAQLSTGISFVKARNNAVIAYLASQINVKENLLENFLNSSNNILAIEYCKSLYRLKSDIIPMTIKRTGSNYNDKNITSKFASATSLREIMQKKQDLHLLQPYIPEPSFNVLNEYLSSGGELIFNTKLFKYLKYKLITNPGAIHNIFDVKEGIEKRIYRNCLISKDLDNFIMNIKTKRYTYTRISRILCQLFIGFENYNTDALLKTSPKYLRVLAFNDKGAAILKMIKNASDIKIITKIPKHFDDTMLSLDIQATNAYSIINKYIKPNADFTTSPFIHKNIIS